MLILKKIYDSWDVHYKSVFGALKKGEDCTFSVRIPDTTKLDYPPMLVIFRTGFKERFINMVETAKEKGCTVFSASYNAIYVGVHYYYFSYMVDGVRSFIKRISSHTGGVSDGELFQLTVYSEEYRTPQFLKGGIMYQIFPDRFCRSGEPHDNIPEDRELRSDWGGIPYYKPKADGSRQIWNYDYFGGDLAGITSKLDYLQELGVTCIYLNPIFEAHENHRYNTANYKKIDPLLGTEDDFRRLCGVAKSKGIKVILDGVFNHTGADSIYFNKFKRYDTIGAYNSAASEYYQWYSFNDYPRSYDSWWGIDSLPNVNENNRSYCDYMFGEDGVILHWLNLGASGYRLDVADELPDEFLDKLHACVKEHNPENVIIGEVWEDASSKESYGVKRRYLLGSQLDSVMNYPFREAIMKFLLGGGSYEFRNTVMTIYENYPKPTVDVLMNFISTHDIERAVNRLSGVKYDDKPKEWLAGRELSYDEYNHGKALTKLAMVMQYFLPGVPCIYYGDEVGLQGWKDPFNRRCYPWGNEDTELLEFARELRDLRNSTRVFMDGRLLFLPFNEDILCFARSRREKKKAALIFVNRSNATQYIEPIESMKNMYRKFLVVKGIEENGKLRMPPLSYAFLKLAL